MQTKDSVALPFSILTQQMLGYDFVNKGLFLRPTEVKFP